jgi:protein-disulfide isomerase
MSGIVHSRINAAFISVAACLSLLAPAGFGATTSPLEKDFAQNLLEDPDSPVLGNPNGSVTVVEFSDYRCPFCKLMESRLQTLLAQDPSVRLVEKDWPVFGGISVYAAEVAIASHWQGKYQAVHTALFALKGDMNEAAVRSAAQGAGVDLARLDHDLSARKDDIDRILNKIHDEALLLRLKGTPGFVIGSFVIPGALTDADLANVVRKARSAQ